MIRNNGMIWYDKNRVVVKLKKKFEERILNSTLAIVCESYEERVQLMQYFESKDVWWTKRAKEDANYFLKVYGESWCWNSFRVVICEGYKELCHGGSCERVLFKDIIKKPKIEFKIGDRVRLKNKLNVGCMYGEIEMLDVMKFEGIKVITETSDGDFYIDGYFYPTEMLKKSKTIKPEFFTDKIAVNCKTEKQARKFLKKLDKMGENIVGLERAFESYDKKLCFRYVRGSHTAFGDIACYKEGYKIADYKEILE